MAIVEARHRHRSKHELIRACKLPVDIARACDDRLRITQDFSFPISASGALVPACFGFLYHHLTLRAGLPPTTTHRTYAQSLDLWMTFLEARGATWSLPTVRLLSEFRVSLADGTLTGRKSNPRTINLREAVVREFYKYAVSCFDTEEHFATSGASAEPIRRFVRQTERGKRARVYKKKPRTLSDPQIAELLLHLNSPHDLIFKWALCTGLRRSSITTLSVGQLPVATPDPMPLIEVLTKGGKPVDVPVTQALLAETRRYIATKRVAWLRGNDDEHVFIGTQGNPISSVAYYRAFKGACRRAGVSAHPHMARHTFAVRLFEAAHRAANSGALIAPRKVVQRLLGHSSAATTAIYLDSLGADAGNALAILGTIQEEILSF